MNLSLRPYRFESADAERGTLTVPMNRAAPGRGVVELVFVRLPATTPSAGPPIVFLNGGPGMSGIRMGRGRLFGFFDALRAHGDVILLDQRGSGESTPSLACAEPLVLPPSPAPPRDEMLRAVIDSTRRCAESLRQAGVDVAAFNTRESAADVAELARTLGAERVSLVGWSYGSHLAFAVMRYFPELVARAALLGPEGPDHTFKLPSRIERQLVTIAERARDAGVATDLFAMLREAIRGRFDLEYVVAQGIADTRMLARLPRWLARMTRGDFSDTANDALLRAYLEEMRVGQVRSLVRFCMDCASGASAERRRRIDDEARTALLGRTIDFPFPEICAAIGCPDLGDAFRAPLRSDVATLFVTGTLDARTPSDNVDDLAPGFRNHRRLVVEDAGHADLLPDPGAQREIANFLARGEIERERVSRENAFRFDPL